MDFSISEWTANARYALQLFHWTKHFLMFEIMWYVSGPTSGSMLDWAKGSLAANYSLTWEIRPYSRTLFLTKSGFRPSKAIIRPTGEEVFAGVKAVAELIKSQWQALSNQGVRITQSSSPISVSVLVGGMVFMLAQSPVKWDARSVRTRSRVSLWSAPVCTSAPMKTTCKKTGISEDIIFQYSCWYFVCNLTGVMIAMQPFV